jgi:SAM-dependent methyltransferase
VPKLNNNDLTCLLCKGQTFRCVYRRNHWSYLKCGGCGLVHLYPQPDYRQAEAIYDDYLSGEPKAIAAWGAMVKPVVMRSADLIENETGKKKGQVLDIGCGYGFFLKEMARRGWQAQGIEISPTGRCYARETLNLSVIDGSRTKSDWPAASFDVITLFYVIEHLADPKAMLGRVLEWLKPGGLLLLRWPHSTPIVRLLGPLAAKLDLYHTPYHIFDFSPRTIKTLVAQCGFCNIRTCIGGYTLPDRPGYRFCSRAFGTVGELVERLSNGRVLMPGVSKTTFAFKAPP